MSISKTITIPGGDYKLKLDKEIMSKLKKAYFKKKRIPRKRKKKEWSVTPIKSFIGEGGAWYVEFDKKTIKKIRKKFKKAT